MKTQKTKKAFTMIELVFTIVIIGILAAVAIPRLAATRDDAEITRARTLVASIRNALAMERQKRILRGNFKKLESVGDSTNVFGNFSDVDGDTGVAVLEYPIASENKKGRWEFSAGTPNQYIFHMLGDVAFKVDGGKFVCVDDTTDACKTLTN